MDKVKKREQWRKASNKYRKTIKGIKNKLKLERYYRKKYRHLLLEFWGNRCKKCGFDDIRALQIDHVKGYGVQHYKELKLNRFSYYKKIYEEVKSGSKKYQLLCANCNWIKRFIKNENTPRRKLKNVVSPKS